MKKYKSLIYREWKISRKQYIVRLALLLLFVGLSSLTMMFLNNSVETSAEDGKAGLTAFSVIMSCLLASLAAILTTEDSGVFKSDINSNWVRYSYALPITAFEKAVTRYIIKIIAIVVGMGIAILSSVAISSMSDSSLSVGVLLCFLAFVDIMLIYDIVQQAIVMRARDAKEMKKMGALASIVAFIAISVLEFIPDDKMDSLKVESPVELISMLENLFNRFGIPMVVLLIVFIVIGFIITWKSFERREE